MIAAPLLSVLVWAGVALCAAIVVVQVSLIVLRLVSSRSETPRLVREDAAPDSVFSVHVATHDEPPRMVAETLRALAAQDWPQDRYEVIVMDNNTADPARWRPVQALCAALGPGFIFLHEMGVMGAKAGALNIALSRTRPDATHIVTVDADYRVDPGFLAAAAEALRDTGANYVQFPQAYFGCTGVAAGVDAELEEYFRTTARMADGAEAVLLTGTLCVISRSALTAAGGWSARTTTEDAETGVRLCRQGFSGRFVDQVVGQGYLPLTLRDLERQRHRWASGNLQTLYIHAVAILAGRDGMGWRRRAAILSQLTAWLNLSLIPAVLLLAVLLTDLLPTRQGKMLLVGLAAVSVVLTALDIVVRLGWRGIADGASPAKLAAAIVNRLALAPVSALAAVEVLLGRRMHFVVTDKSGTCGRDLPVASAALFALAVAALAPAAEHGVLAAAAVLALMTPFPAALVTARTLARYRAALVRPTEGELA